MTSLQQNVSSIVVDRFWDWFVSAAPKMARLFEMEDAQTLGAIVQPKVDSLNGGLGWEIGPNEIGGLFFALTFQGNREQIALAEQVIRAAPTIPGWSFHYGKRPRVWNGRFSLLNSSEDEIWLNCSNWQYQLTAFSDNEFFDVHLFADDLPSMSDTMKQQAALLVVDSYLEKTAVERIDRITLEAPISIEIANSLTPLRYLPNHIQSLLHR